MCKDLKTWFLLYLVEHSIACQGKYCPLTWQQWNTLSMTMWWRQCEAQAKLLRTWFKFGLYWERWWNYLWCFNVSFTPHFTIELSAVLGGLFVIWINILKYNTSNHAIYFFLSLTDTVELLENKAFIFETGSVLSARNCPINTQSHKVAKRNP